MMKGSKANLSALAEKCKTVIVSNWQGYLNTVKPEDKASIIHTSKIKYVMRRGKPYLWVPESEPHNVNIMFDERGSFSIAHPYPGPLAALFKSIGKLPERVAFTGEIVPVKEKRVDAVKKYVEEAIQSEMKAISNTPNSVRSILNSSDQMYASRCDSLRALIDDAKEKYVIYKFVPSSCMFIDPNGTKEIDLKVLELSKPDPLGNWSTKLVDGINKNESRRRALILFCLYFLDINARDAYMVSVDRKGFHLLGKVPSEQEAGDEYQWREFRFEFEEEVKDVEAFCHQLVEMEQEVVSKFTDHTGL
ncbi:putative FMN-binding split barrel, hem oxygenase HugZ-like superfamily [Arabidopsis thaliana]